MSSRCCVVRREEMNEIGKSQQSVHRAESRIDILTSARWRAKQICPCSNPGEALARISSAVR